MKERNHDYGHLVLEEDLRQWKTNLCICNCEEWERVMAVSWRAKKVRWWYGHGGWHDSNSCNLKSGTKEERPRHEGLSVVVGCCDCACMVAETISVVAARMAFCWSVQIESNEREICIQYI